MSVSGELTELKRLLSLGGHTLVWRVGGATGTSDERGIAPLNKKMQFLPLVTLINSCKQTLYLSRG